MSIERNGTLIVSATRQLIENKSWTFHSQQNIVPTALTYHWVLTVDHWVVYISLYLLGTLSSHGELC